MIRQLKLTAKESLRHKALPCLDTTFNYSLLSILYHHPFTLTYALIVPQVLPSEIP